LYGIDYRKGSDLVSFFNRHGFHDSYGQGFPSRWFYTQEKLNSLNGTPDLDGCIKEVFAPVNFIGKKDLLVKCLKDFNDYLAFDGWKVIIQNNEVSFKRASASVTVDTDVVPDIHETESDFLSTEFAEIDINRLPIENQVKPYISQRIDEMKACLENKIPLSAIFLIGSTLEGVFLGLASKYPANFNSANAAPKEKDGKVRSFDRWTLGSYIDVACELDYIKSDVKKFSMALRDFRNYIHPYQQMSSGFSPDEHTAKICFQVLKAALFQINKKQEL
jgi:hypothetical protein